MRYCLSALPGIDEWLSSADRVLIATDFDGVLCPIADSPCDVRVAPSMLQILRHITQCERITLAVISGRAIADVRCRVPLDAIFAGNHGLEIAGEGLSFEHPGALQVRGTLVEACAGLSQAIRLWSEAWVEDKGLSATLHYRQVDSGLYSGLLFTARRFLSQFGGQLALRAGNKALELRPKTPWDKGAALDYIREHRGPFDATICIGDDRTDEMMFRANDGQLNIRVGVKRPSHATYYLSDPGEVAIFLSHVVDVCQYHHQAAVATAEAAKAVSPAANDAADAVSVFHAILEVKPHSVVRFTAAPRCAPIAAPPDAWNVILEISKRDHHASH